MTLNTQRERLRRSLDAARGFGVANSSDDLGREWADAAADDESEVEDLAFQWRKARTASRIASRIANRPAQGD